MMPMFHTAQLNCHCTPAVMVGATHVHRCAASTPPRCSSSSRRADHPDLRPADDVPALVDHPTSSERDLPSLRQAAYAMAPMPDGAAAPLPRDVRLRLLPAVRADRDEPHDHLLPARAPAQPRRRGRHARWSTCRSAIMDADGNLLPRGEEGEIVYRGPHALTGYLNNPEATEAAFAHGWFHSGDVGHLRRRRHAVVQRPPQGRHQDRRRERRLDRGREGALRRRPGHRRGGGRRAAARALDRGDHRDRRAEPGHPARRGGAARRVREHAGRLQDAQGGDRRRRVAQDVHRQDPEERACASSSPGSTTSTPPIPAE